MYDHSAQTWGHEGSFTCPWDTSHNAGVLVPHESFESELEGLSEEEVRKKADHFLEIFNQWVHGDVWGFSVIETNMEPLEDEGCWSYFGEKDLLAGINDILGKEITFLFTPNTPCWVTEALADRKCPHGGLD